MYLQPLEPGQEFSFVVPQRFMVRTGPSGKIFTPEAAWSHAPTTERRELSPTERLVAQDDLYAAVDGTWTVRAWLPGLNRFISFGQLINEEAQAELFSHIPQVTSVHRIAVTNVRWPTPTPEILAVHLRALSYWRDGRAAAGIRTRRQYRWHDCEAVRHLPLDEGLPRVLQMLDGYLDDPAVALRERGFVV